MKDILLDSLNKTIEQSCDKTLSTIADSPVLSFLDVSLFGSVPILSSIVSAYKIGNTIREASHIKKIATFLNCIATNKDNKKLKSYIERLKNDANFRDKEVEYLVLLLDRYFENEKAEILAKLFIAFLENYINWKTFKSLSVSLDTILIEDIDVLKHGYLYTHNFSGPNGASIMRLLSAGLIYEEKKDPQLTSELTIKTDPFVDFKWTDQGYLLCECIKRY